MLPSKASIYVVFHVSQLKLKLEQNQRVQHIPSVVTKELELRLMPKTVMRARWSKELAVNEGRGKWKGVQDNEKTWELVYLKNQPFPSFHLENKVHFETYGNVRSLILHTYIRKGKRETPRICQGRAEERG